MFKRRAVLAASAASLLAVSPGAWAKSVLDDPIVKSSGDWVLHKGVDTFEDKTNCVILIKGRSDFQATDDTLYYRAERGVQSYRFRFDAGAPSELVLASKIEQKIDAVVLEGPAFRQALKSERFRLQGSGLLSNSSFQEDINLVGLKDLITEWKKQACPSS